MKKLPSRWSAKSCILPTIALRGLVVFPNNLVHFEVGREKSIAAVEWAMANNSNVFLVAQKSMDTTEPQQADLFSYGVVAEVKAGAARLRASLSRCWWRASTAPSCSDAGCQRAIFCFRRCCHGRRRCAGQGRSMPRATEALVRSAARSWV